MKYDKLQTDNQYDPSSLKLSLILNQKMDNLRPSTYILLMMVTAGDLAFCILLFLTHDFLNILNYFQSCQGRTWLKRKGIDTRVLVYFGMRPFFCLSSYSIRSRKPIHYRNVPLLVVSFGSSVQDLEHGDSGSREVYLRYLSV